MNDIRLHRTATRSGRGSRRTRLRRGRRCTRFRRGRRCSNCTHTRFWSECCCSWLLLARFWSLFLITRLCCKPKLTHNVGIGYVAVIYYQIPLITLITGRGTGSRLVGGWLTLLTRRGAGSRLTCLQLTLLTKRGVRSRRSVRWKRRCWCWARCYRSFLSALSTRSRNVDCCCRLTRRSPRCC